MKIRNGFVSNSSSCSFTLVTTRECHELALSKMPAELAKMIEQISGHKKLGNTDIVIIAAYFAENGQCNNQIGCWNKLDDEPFIYDHRRNDDPSLSKAICEYEEAIGTDEWISGSINRS